MSEIVLELKNRNWTNDRIARELGMDKDEILRLCQISGLQDLFKDSDFSKSWDADLSVEDYEPITDELNEEDLDVRTINTSDENRFFHTFDKWECHKAGFYQPTKFGMKQSECENEYLRVLSNLDLFEEALNKVINEWVYSCEHYLTNKSMNRIAWLGQASVCYLTGVPSKFSSGWFLLSDEEKNKANNLALKYLNIWLEKYGFEKVELNEALSLGRQVNIY